MANIVFLRTNVKATKNSAHSRDVGGAWNARSSGAMVARKDPVRDRLGGATMAVAGACRDAGHGQAATTAPGDSRAAQSGQLCSLTAASAQCASAPDDTPNRDKTRNSGSRGGRSDIVDDNAARYAWHSSGGREGATNGGMAVAGRDAADSNSCCSGSGSGFAAAPGMT